MATTNFFRTGFLWVIMLLPFAYLAMIYGDLPDQVPTHFNIEGEADDWSAKSTLWIVPALMVFGTYGLMLLIPKIDPKGQVQQMGNKYEMITFLMVVLMAVIALFIIYAAKGGLISISILLAVLGLFYIVLGNYFPTIKHNYFVGIRTPWTLESEKIWRKTHQLAGPLWMLGGLLIILLCLLLDATLAFRVFMGITLLIALIPIVYSYRIFKEG